jgi:hypothetical protein
MKVEKKSELIGGGGFYRHPVVYTQSNELTRGLSGIVSTF